MSVTYTPLWQILNHRKLSPAQLRKSTGIAPNTMTKLRRNEEVSLSILGRICSYLKCDYGDIVGYVETENTDEVNEYGTFSINNRRYLGNKHKLLPFITHIVSEYCKNVFSVADVFSGTGSVASAFMDRQIITNDIMYSNYICNFAWFGSEDYDEKKIKKIIIDYNRLETNEENYMTRSFSDTYFSHDDCSKIGFIREDIEQKFRSGIINERERALLIMTLIYAMDRIANTCGHYDAYIQGAAFERHLVLSVPTASHDNFFSNYCYNEDANELVKRIYADLVYIDPPYNSRQYCDSYHLLENISRWEQPEVFGIARKMDRQSLKSKYCTRSAETVFEDLIQNIKARYILLSYNNMANKGNDRSNAKISDEAILRILGDKGKTRVFEKNYRAFSAGKSDISDNTERLFLCTCER